MGGCVCVGGGQVAPLVPPPRGDATVFVACLSNTFYVFSTFTFRLRSVSTAP